MSTETGNAAGGIRKVEAGDALSWFTRAVDVGGRQARGLFGAAALGVLVTGAALMLAGMLLAVVVAAGGVDPKDMSAGMLLALPLVLLVWALAPVLGGGMQQVLHQAENGQPVAASDIFAGFSRGRFWSLAGLAILPLAGLALTLVNYTLFGGPDYFVQYVAMLEDMAAQRPPVPPEVRSPALLFLAGLAVNIVQTVLQAITVPLAQLSGRGTLGAIADGLRMMARNPGAVLVALALALVAVLVLAVVLGIGGLILVLLAGLVPLLGVPLLLLALFVVVVLVFVVGHGIAYYAWRDLFAAADRAAPAAPASLEV